MVHHVWGLGDGVAGDSREPGGAGEGVRQDKQLREVRRARNSKKVSEGVASVAGEG